MDKEIIANIKALGIDMINQAGSGHPGIVLGAAPIIYTLYAKHLNMSTKDNNWVNRDRFVLSAGHGSALLYATLFMSGIGLTIDDLKNFRRSDYKTPGHPELGVTPGVTISTGPLGQGLASAVGMAIAEKILERKFVLPSGKSLINYNVYALCSDGDLMEGITNEACSLAGNLCLNNLIVLYDSNAISLDGPTTSTFTEDVLGRFKALGWNTEFVKDGNDVRAIDHAIIKAKTSSKPTIIEIKTIIGADAPMAGTNEVHGKPLDRNATSLVKTKLGLPNEPFYHSNEAMDKFREQIVKHSANKYNEWAINYKEYVSNVVHNDMSELQFLFEETINYQLRDDIINTIYQNYEDRISMRDVNGRIMQYISDNVRNFIGGSADLSSSTKTRLIKENDITSKNFNGKNIWFGVREHAMGAILNGLAVSGFRVFGSTFLAFADYMKPAIRMAALMHLPVTYIYTHDSISIGQDGPTHQPVEQLAMLRATPNLKVYRPADAKEIIGSWNCILHDYTGPSVLVISRNDVNLLPATDSSLVEKGGYIMQKEQGPLHGIIIATGTEVHTAFHIVKELYEEQQLNIRIVSMPCMELFINQPADYQEQVLPLGVKRIVIEAGTGFGWHRFVYSPKYLITVDNFGISGTRDEVLEHCDFSYQNIKDQIIKLLK